MNMSTRIWESTHSFSKKQSTIIFCWKFGWATFSKTLSTIIGKNTPISAFNPGLNLDIKLIKIEQDSWKTIKWAEALFFKRDRHRYCLIAPRNLLDWKEFIRSRHVGPVWYDIQTSYVSLSLTDKKRFSSNIDIQLQISELLMLIRLSTSM